MRPACGSAQCVAGLPKPIASDATKGRLSSGGTRRRSTRLGGLALVPLMLIEAMSNSNQSRYRWAGRHGQCLGDSAGMQGGSQAYARCQALGGGQAAVYTRRSGGASQGAWRRGSESNRRRRLCRPLHDHSATPPGEAARQGGERNRCRAAPLPHPASRGGRRPSGAATKRGKQALSPGSGAGNESRTRDLNLGKVALYQLSYSREKQARIIA